ncbi:hypothetical protein AB3G45_12450 [Shinella sp. S4-D37]|uniref:hypothetical protein n=1 Tax=Shinella sp. S4-D37 TaxID=3161999 RepID=UPI003465CDE7
MSDSIWEEDHIVDREEIFQATIRQYLESRDFNGWGTFHLADPQEIQAVIGLIEDRLIDIITHEDDENIHIKRHDPRLPDVQIERLRRPREPSHGCLYPTPEALRRYGVVHDATRPYTSALREGAPQLDFRAFRLDVLEQYRNDPRYRYEVDDIHGTIYREHPNVEDDEFHKFGFAFDPEINRYVATFLRYLNHLSPEQQQSWRRFEVEGDFGLHPDYYRTSILGQFPERVSVFDAFLKEKRIINEMCACMGKPALFRSDYDAYRRPAGFGFLIRPTRAEFSTFCLLLDQLLSDDMDRDFFRGDIEMDERGRMDNGREIVQPKGTIRLLDEWIDENFRMDDEDFKRDLMTGFRSVRQARQRPAHRIEDNVFDEAYYRQQRELIRGAYTSVRTLRQCFANHPRCQDVEVPDWLFEGRIWTR